MRLLNPVVGRELRQRLRSGRSFVALTLFLAVLTFLTWAVVAAVTANSSSQQDLTRATGAGRPLLDVLSIGMLVLMVFLLPGLAAASVSGERERQTLVPLQITLLRPRSIVIGKVLAASAFAMLLLVASAPMFAAGYVLGGVALAPTLRTMVALLVVATVIIAISVGWSTILRRSVAAVVASYATILVLCVAAPIAFALLSVLARNPIDGGNDVNRFKPMVLVNPLVAVAMFQQPGANPNGSGGGALDGIRDSMRGRGFDDLAAQEVVDDDVAGVPDWLVSFASLGAVAVAAGAVGSRRLRTPARSER
ncbi:MAG: ABC transporter permease [Acidimicrobiales bacterium]